MVWGNDDFFGGMFDFNSDGQTDAVEAAIGFQVLDVVKNKTAPENRIIAAVGSGCSITDYCISVVFPFVSTKMFILSRYALSS